MAINWDIVHELAKKEAELYSSKYQDAAVKAAAFNGYFDGYIKNAAERESLRLINERLQKDTRPAPVAAPSMLGSFF